VSAEAQPWPRPLGVKYNTETTMGLDQRYRRLAGLAGFTAAALLVTATAQAQGHENDAARGTVYTMSNAAAGNAILVFAQDANGGLTAADSYPTGGLGTGGGLGNQGALAHDGEFLYAVNAGSDDVSVLRFTEDGLELADVAPSGGIQPVSVTVDRGVVYVLNAGSDSIAGFAVGLDGTLAALPGSVQSLSGTGTGPAQIQFSKDGRTLIVTEKATNSLVTFSLDRFGVPIDRQVFASPGATPFGFAPGPGRRLYVSEAAGGAAGASSVTSWQVHPDGGLEVITPTAASSQTAACWVALSPDGRFAYTTNTGSGTISAYRIRGGQLELLDAGVTGITGPGSSPIDVVITAGGRYLHALLAGTDVIATFRVGRDGSLTWVSETSSLPDGANGLAAR